MAEETQELTPEEKDLSAAQIAKCAPIAATVLKMVTDAALPMGEIKKEDLDKRNLYDAVRKAILQLYLDNDLTRSDCDMVGALALQPTSLVLKGVEHSLAISWDNAKEKKWGKTEGHVTLREMDALLKVDSAPVFTAPQVSDTAPEATAPEVVA